MRPGAALAAAALAAGACAPAEERDMTPAEVAAELGNMRVSPGLWELGTDIVEVRAPDLPHEVRRQMLGPRSRLRHCITPQQAARPSANFLAAREDSACAYRGFAVRDGRIEGTMLCPGIAAAMRGRYTPRDYETHMEMRSPLPDKATMTVEVRAWGRRIGECDEAE